MSPNRPTSSSQQGLEPRTLLWRALRIALAILALLCVGVGIVVWLGGDPSTLPLDYDGFD